MIWNVADAKNRLSEVLDRAGTEGPQKIRRRGQACVLIPEAQYEELTGKRASFIDFLRKGPRVDRLKPMPRSKSPMRATGL
jgi:prevent-host-death family protein